MLGRGLPGWLPRTPPPHTSPPSFAPAMIGSLLGAPLAAGVASRCGTQAGPLTTDRGRPAARSTLHARVCPGRPFSCLLLIPALLPPLGWCRPDEGRGDLGGQGHHHCPLQIFSFGFRPQPLHLCNSSAPPTSLLTSGCLLTVAADVENACVCSFLLLTLPSLCCFLISDSTGHQGTCLRQQLSSLWAVTGGIGERTSPQVCV